ncbi:metal resistance protein YCF1 [Lentinus tigrinus ALCF2SS1-7]|uniref:Metal resistance protein YCF1 n=1 Tax=Lentinus tigrinus ALCF2SS1-6 TaxID=1328759 RepID=A0A5C2S8D5_9APHY|nr:metal resistance protein YCF1 [Lentinus tigrinus ALCF2SS1-6]RPD74761.1 metal resistance protein YCF1 [Lentinus tigrinus ALCF2SS1-7]
MSIALACRGDPEGWGPVSRIRPFDLTSCFEEGAVLSPLLVIFLGSAVVACWTHRGREVLERRGRSIWILRAKLLLLSLACAASCANLIYIFATRSPISFLPLYLLEFVALLVAPILTVLNHYRSRTSSATLLLFWPVYALATLIWGRTTLTNNGLLPVVAIRSVVVLLGFIAFALECLGPEPDEPEHFSKGHAESPLLTANIFSQWSFSWMNRLMKKGAAEYITENDLPGLRPKDETAELGNRLKQGMEKHSSLWMALFVAYGGPYAFALGLKLIQDSLAFLQPQLLRWLLSYIASYQSSHRSGTEDHSAIEGFSIAAIMFGASIVQTIILHQYFQHCFETGMRVRSGLITAIYQKALVLSNDGRSSATGDIVNLMSVDAARLQDLCTYGLISISGPYQIMLAFISLYNIMGWPAFVGVAVMIVSIPLNTAIARLLKRQQEQQMKNRDKRTRLMSDLLNNISSIKLYAWENAFIRWISTVRNEEELKMLRKIGIVTSLNTSLWTGIPLLVAFSSFAVAAYTSSVSLTSDKIFPAISLYMLLQFPLSMFSMVTSNIIEALVSVKRLSDFFHADELQPDVRQVVDSSADLDEGDVVVSVTNGDFSWNKNAVSPTLEGINLTVRKGELVGVLGRVGAGKTSLLSAIIGEMMRLDGEVKVFGTISYAPQNAWIMSATIRDNILFSHKYDEEFYNIVLDACALRPDLALMPQGDMTEVGEKGITLSGGQRARVALARAVYARADLIMLDDVLAALDSHVAKHVFDHVIGPNGLLASKARIVVTNSIHFLKHFHQIYYIRRGIILESGSYAELVTNPQCELHKLVKGHGNLAATVTSGMSTPFITGFSNTPDSEGDSKTAVDSVELTEEKLETVDKTLVRRKSYGKAVIDDSLPTKTASDGPTKEHSEQGRVKSEVYYRYLEAASKAGFISFVVATILQQIANLLGNNMLREWGNHNNEVSGNEGSGIYLLGYGLFSLSSTILGAVAALLIWVLCSVRSAQRLHDSMLNAVMHAPLTFFELTPTGRILNLFSRDTYVVDMILARVIQNTVRTLATTAMILVVIGYSFPLFLIAVPPLAWFYIRVMIYYLATSRELKRLDAVSRSPIFAWFSESLNGLSTIRAFGQQQLFIANNERRVDRNQICYLPSISVNRWLAVRLEFVGATIIFIAAILSIVALVTTGVDAGLVGFVLSYALNTTGSLNWLVRSASEVEQNIVSVERILHYIELPPEAPWEVPQNVPEHWPTQGEVEFRQYSARYRPELDLVLKDLNVKIKGHEKIGIVGRTGSGKSSLLLSLFRIIEPASGTICIDGVDITKIGLHDLRSAISIVPQSPDLFEGSIRDNIDPMGVSSDADIWVALEQTHLKSYVESLQGGLDAPVREGGSSLSAGQRQLLCFARALLRKSKILVLDEATSAVDLDTDKAIQEIIRGPQFAHVTMLTIAHRINTILESDRVLVLEAGKVIEFDTPQALLANKQSAFHSLAAQAGLA